MENHIGTLIIILPLLIFTTFSFSGSKTWRTVRIPRDDYTNTRKQSGQTLNCHKTTNARQTRLDSLFREVFTFNGYSTIFCHDKRTKLTFGIPDDISHTKLCSHDSKAWKAAVWTCNCRCMKNARYYSPDVPPFREYRRLFNNTSSRQTSETYFWHSRQRLPRETRPQQAENSKNTEQLRAWTSTLQFIIELNICTYRNDWVSRSVNQSM